MEDNNSLTIIESIDSRKVETVLQKINAFQQTVAKLLKQDSDYGIIPGTKRPTLLKPGGEKIAMLMGLTQEYKIVDSTRDFEKGFFQYQVSCRLKKGEVILTEGLGSANTREPKNIKLDPWGQDNTILKMAKKRAFIDAILMVASLSEIFTQDIGDDLEGHSVADQPKINVAHDSEELITPAQAKRMYAISGGNAELCKAILQAYGYSKSDQVKKVDYERLCTEIKAEADMLRAEREQ